MRATSEVDVGTHLIEKEVIADAFSNNEVDTQDIERVKIVPNKICIREDLAKEKRGVQQRVQPCRLQNGQCGAH